MSNFLNVKGLSRLAMIFVAGLSVACGKVQFEERTAISDAPQGGFGTLRLTSATFPEGAESLTLAIVELGSHFDDCNMIQPLPDQQSKEQVVEGLGLSKIPRPDAWRKCIPSIIPHSEEANTNALDELAKGVRVIHVQRGQEITPIRLRTGSYQITADFFDKSNELLYTGSEFFDVQDGEQKSINIRLKKVESGEVTIGFEVEKPIQGPTRLSTSDDIDFQKTEIDKSGRKHLKKISLNGELGVASLTMAAYVDRPSVPKMPTKVKLSKTQIKLITKILDKVELSKMPFGLCVDPIEIIDINVRTCKNCEPGAKYNYSNGGCGHKGIGQHNLNGKQFEDLWNIIGKSK